MQNSQSHSKRLCQWNHPPLGQCSLSLWPKSIIKSMAKVRWLHSLQEYAYTLEGLSVVSWTKCEPTPKLKPYIVAETQWPPEGGCWTLYVSRLSLVITTAKFTSRRDRNRRHPHRKSDRQCWKRGVRVWVLQPASQPAKLYTYSSRSFNSGSSSSLPEIVQEICRSSRFVCILYGHHLQLG